MVNVILGIRRGCIDSWLIRKRFSQIIILIPLLIVLRTAWKIILIQSTLELNTDTHVSVGRPVGPNIYPQTKSMSLNVICHVPVMKA